MNTNIENYNGWTNRETWAFALHIDNEAWLSQTVADAVSEIITDDTCDVKPYQVAEYLKNVMDQLKAWRFEDNEVNQDIVSIVDDIGSDYRIDYRELAEYYISNFKENK